MLCVQAFGMALHYGDDGPGNVLAVWTDDSASTGWW